MKTKPKDSIGDRMKNYEAHETLRRAMKRLPLCVRVDGRAFHTFTRGLDRPFDEGFSKAMIETTKFLVAKTHAKVGYTQSDEITLVFWDSSYKAEPLFGGKLFKLTSIIASLASAQFNRLIPEHIPSKVDNDVVVFDARVFQVPSLDEAANLLLWRWIDARKNSISMAAQAQFSPKQLHGKAASLRLDLLRAKGVEWNDFPDHLKWGTFVRRTAVERELTEAELSKIPEAHRPTGKQFRNDYIELKLPPFIEIDNRVEVIFEGAEPTLRSAQDRPHH